MGHPVSGVGTKDCREIRDLLPDILYFAQFVSLPT